MSSPSIEKNYDHLLNENYLSFPSVNTSHNGILRRIFKYELKTDIASSNFIKQNAALKVATLLESNSHLIPTFEFNGDLKILQDLITQNRFLTINGNAVCLANAAFAPPGAEPFCDDFFSQTMLIEPVKCQEGHLFEKSRAILYSQKCSGKCPLGHEMGKLQEDPILMANYHKMKSKIEEEEKQNSRVDQALNSNQVITNVNQIDFARLLKYAEALNKRRLDRTAISSNLGKVSLKLGARGIAWNSGKLIAGKSGAKTAVKLTKYFPIASIVIGLGLGCYRLTLGQPKKAIIEVFSGLIVNVPRVGMYLSAATDIGLFVSDIRDATRDAVIKMDIKVYYDFLGLAAEGATKEAVDQAIEKVDAVLNSCHLSVKEKIAKALEEAKKAIYEQHKWKSESN